MTHILLAHAPEAAERAQLVAAKLAALGLEVRQRPRAQGPIARRRLASAIDDAACVVVVAPGGDPVLRAAQRRARNAGKLAHWTGRDSTRAWRGLVCAIRAKANAAAAAPTPAPRRQHNLLMLAVGFLVVYGVLLVAASLFT